MTRIVADLNLHRRYLHDEVADRLRALILAGDLPPRSRVNEIELAERFGISRTPLREAIKILATEGLLELLPNRGARVAVLSSEEIEDMLTVIGGLEGVAAELACKRISNAEIDAIAADHASMVEHWRSGDEPAYFARNRAIHVAIMAAARNPTLSAIYNNLSGRVARARYVAHKTPQQWSKAIEEHQRMLELLRRRQGPKLAQLMREHLRGKTPVIAAAFGKDAAGPAEDDDSDG
jgi:DNA-binding GntR family transcriptional regulator